MTAGRNDIHKYSIESGIPIAPRNEHKAKYPFAQMSVGQSFAFPGEEIERVRQSAHVAARRHAPMKFSVSASMLRCWSAA